MENRWKNHTFQIRKKKIFLGEKFFLGGKMTPLPENFILFPERATCTTILWKRRPARTYRMRLPARQTWPIFRDGPCKMGHCRKGKRPRGGWVTLSYTRSLALSIPPGRRSISITTSGQWILAFAKNTNNGVTLGGPCDPPMGNFRIWPSRASIRVPTKLIGIGITVWNSTVFPKVKPNGAHPQIGKKN